MVIVPARKPAVGLPDASNLGARREREGVAALPLGFGADFLTWRLVSVLMAAKCARVRGKARTRVNAHTLFCGEFVRRRDGGGMICGGQFEKR